MRAFPSKALACALLFALISPAAALDDKLDATLDCLAIMASLNQTPNQRQQLESLIGGYFYLGRLPPDYHIETVGKDVAAAFSKLSAADLIAETTRCEKEMQAQGKLMVAIGAAIPKPSTIPDDSQQFKKPH